MLYRRSTLLMPALLLLARCGSSPPPPPSLALDIRAGADQNPNPEGQPSPVAIRIYQLAALGLFDQADVFALTDHELRTLGPDGLRSEALIVAPGERRRQIFDVMPNTRFIGAIALFRDIDEAAWRVHAAVATNGVTQLTLETSRNQLRIAPG
jgi:type VI secretion system protein VasD